MSEEPAFYTMKQAAEKTGYSYDQIRYLVRSGRLKVSRKFGAHPRIPRSVIDDEVEALARLNRQYRDDDAV